MAVLLRTLHISMQRCWRFIFKIEEDQNASRGNGRRISDRITDTLRDNWPSTSSNKEVKIMSYLGKNKLSFARLNVRKFNCS